METLQKTKTAAIYHITHVYTPYIYDAKLFITDCPKDLSIRELKNLLTSNGYDFGEFGIPFANIDIDFGSKNWPSQVLGQWKKGKVETIKYDSLLVEDFD